MNDIDKFAKEGVLKILVGNKCDLEENRKVSKIKGKQLADSYGIDFIETSAKNREGIEQLFITASRAFIESQEKGGMGADGKVKAKINPNSSAINLSSKKLDAKKKKGCC